MVNFSGPARYRRRRQLPVAFVAAKIARVSASFRFGVKTRGYPKATITESGELPSGITLTDNGDAQATLAWTSAPSSARTYPITIMASNGVGEPASQHFTLTVRA
jgi:hypothetical protein